MTTSSALDDDGARDAADGTSEPADGNRESTDPAAAAPAGRDRTMRGAALLATLIALPSRCWWPCWPSPSSARTRRPPRRRPSATAARAQSTAPVEMAAPALAAPPGHGLPGPALPAAGDASATWPSGRSPPARSRTPRTATPRSPWPAAAPSRPSRRTDDVWTVNRVCWHPAEQAGRDRAHHGRPGGAGHGDACPRSYEQPLQWVPPISSTIVATVPSGGAVPSGCRR